MEGETIHIKIPIDILNACRKLAQDEERTILDVIRMAIRFYLKARKQTV